METLNSLSKKLGIKGLNDLYKYIVEERVEDTEKLKISIEERIKKLIEEKIKNRKYHYIYHTYNKKYLKYYNEYQSKRRKIDIKFKLNRDISCSIRRTLKGNKHRRHWEELLGYTINELKNHLQKTIPKNYNWQDFLQGKLHLDHIIPISVFNFDNPEHIDFKRCWDLKNLRLLPAKDNLIKSNHLDKPFQPALKI